MPANSAAGAAAEVSTTQQPAPNMPEELISKGIVSGFFQLLDDEVRFTSKYCEEILKLYPARKNLDSSEAFKTEFYGQFYTWENANLPTEALAIEKFKANKVLPKDKRIAWKGNKELTEGRRLHRNQESRKVKQWGRFVELLHPNAKETKRLKQLMQKRKQQTLVSLLIVS